jgi:hypothetical protein
MWESVFRHHLLHRAVGSLEFAMQESDTEEYGAIRASCDKSILRYDARRSLFFGGRSDDTGVFLPVVINHIDSACKGYQLNCDYGKEQNMPTIDNFSTIGIAKMYRTPRWKHDQRKLLSSDPQQGHGRDVSLG